jgi:hypothetical protein
MLVMRPARGKRGHERLDGDRCASCRSDAGAARVVDGLIPMLIALFSRD